ncbi:MAG: hypothetical protein IJY12_04105 [Clostridia bacterium]|nr:hypothetical protein [Clostridia bacterium]
MIKFYLTLPFRACYCIATDCEVLARELNFQYGRYLLTEGKAERSLTVTREASRYRFASPDEEFSTDLPLQAIDRYLFEQADYDPHIFALHGAAVAWDGQCFLFPAATTGGKTTLTAYLTEQGFGYLTDDCILLDREDFRIHPCAEPLHLRDGGVEVLRRYGALPDGLQSLGEATRRRYVYTPKTAVTEALPLRCIYFIERTEDENRVVPMSMNERIAALMQSPITPYTVTGEYLRFLSRLARVDCYRLRYKDMDYVKELLQNGSGATE